MGLFVGLGQSSGLGQLRILAISQLQISAALDSAPGSQAISIWHLGAPGPSVSGEEGGWGAQAGVVLGRAAQVKPKQSRAFRQRGWGRAGADRWAGGTERSSRDRLQGR